MPPLQVAFSLVAIIAIIIGCYYATYYISDRASGRSRGRLRNKNINLVDRFAISRDKSFCLIEIAGKVYIIGVTNQSMTLLDTLDAAVFEHTAAERRDKVIWPAASDGRITSRLTRRLAVFMAARMGRTIEEITPETGAPESGGDNDGATFAESMKNARGKDGSGQPDSEQVSQADDPENKL